MKRCTDGWTLLMAVPFLTQVAVAQAAGCEETLQQIQAFYNKTVDNCPGDSGEAQAAYNCSGLIARGTKRPEHTGGKAGDYYVWQTSPKSREQGNIAATYLRKDVIFADVHVKGDVWTNFNDGFLLMPPWLVTNQADRSYIDCAFPADAWAFERADKGCGDNQKTPGVETTCDSLGVNGQNWVDKYFEPYKYSQSELIGGTSCAFDLRTTDGAKSAEAFKQFLDARKAMQNVANQDTAFGSYPEVRYTNPASNESVPWAFYYTDPAGREDALKNRDEYKKLKGVDIPVIQIQFPRDKNSQATFSCEAGPTPGPAPVPEPGGNATELAAGGWGLGDDPKKCSRYFDSVVWINRWDAYLNQHVDSVSVTPSACGREIGADQTDAAMEEMKQKATSVPGGAKKWGDRDATLRRQYVCHISLVEENGSSVRYKQEYNLEPIRSYVSHEQSLEAKCNPPLTDNKIGGGWGPGGSAQCTQYVSSVKWVRRQFPEYGSQQVMSLEVTPTDCGRNIGPDQNAKMMAEIKKKALAADPKGAEYWGAKDDSMRRQTVCLMKMYREKPTWNIESIRPNGVSAVQAEAAHCNFK